MFKFHVKSGDFAEAMRKISIAIPASAPKGGNDCIKMVCYKNVKSVNKPIGILAAFDGKTQSVSPFEIHDVSSEEQEIVVHISGKQALAAANAYAALEAGLEITIDKEVKISGAGSKVTLQLGQEIVSLKADDKWDIRIEADKEEFVNFINFAASCYGEEKGSRGLHCVGIRLDEEKKTMTAVSSNGTRCAYAETNRFTFCAAKKKGKAEAKKEEEQKETNRQATVVIEGKLLRNAVKNLVQKKVTIGISDKKIQIKSGTDVVIILTQEIPFPMDAVLEVIKKCEKKGVWKAKLSNVFQALAIYEITMEKPWVEINKKGDTQICLQGKDELTTASIVCAQEGDVQRVVVDERELKNALSVFAKDQEILVEMNSADMPITIRQHEEDPNRIIVLPIAGE